MEGNEFLSTTVMEVFLYRGFLQSAQAVDRPKAPLPTISTDAGVSNEDAAGVMAREYLCTMHTKLQGVRKDHDEFKLYPTCGLIWVDFAEKPISRIGRVGASDGCCRYKIWSSGHSDLREELGPPAWQRPCKHTRFALIHAFN